MAKDLKAEAQERRLDVARRERRALADADGRKEYSDAELEQGLADGIPRPYVDVLALSERHGNLQAEELANRPSAAELERADALKNERIALEQAKAALAAEAKSAAPREAAIKKREADVKKARADVEAARKATEAQKHRNALESERNRIEGELKK